MRVLFVTYFFPPAGGAGPVRPLKLAGHLVELGFEVHVLAPADPRWIYRDDSSSPPAGVIVHRAPYHGPQTRKLRDALQGRSAAGRAVAHARAAIPRLLVPDEHVLWLPTALPAAVEIVRREGIDAVVTTSPPTSIHLLGAAVRRRTHVRWVADVRDSIGSHPHRRVDRAAVRLKERAEVALARGALRGADALVASSGSIAGELRSLAPGKRVEEIANGCDFEDFDGLAYEPAERFRITHTGLFFGSRDPRPFLSALATSGLDVVARFVGDFRPADLAWARRAGLADRLEIHPYASRARTLAWQRDSEALLLLVPDANGRGRGVVTAKLFEYLAAERPILAAVPPDGAAAALVEETGAGIVVPPRDVDAIRDALRRLVAMRGTAVPLRPDLRSRLSRRRRAEELAALLSTL